MVTPPRQLVPLGLLICLGVAACADPTESNAVINLSNDLGGRVVLAPCDDSHCHSLAGTVRNHLAPGESVPVNVSADGVPTYYSIVAESGRPARCLTLVVHKTPVNSVVPLSTSQDCRTN